MISKDRPANLSRQRNLPLTSEEKDEVYIRLMERRNRADYTEGLAVYNTVKRLPIADYVETGLVIPYDIKDGSGNDLYPAHSENLLFKQKRQRTTKKEKRIIEWSLPGRDVSSLKDKKCGLVKVYSEGVEGGSPEIIACSADHEHYSRVKKRGCGQLSCPVCYNDASFRRAQRIEQKVLFHRTRCIKEERSADRIVSDRRDLALGHWVISFSKESGAASMVRTVIGYKKLVDITKALLVEAGMSGGALVFHPWRWSSENRRWEIGPHFHVIGYGWLDTKTFQSKYSPNINLIKVHEHEDIRSVFLTASYLLSHTGIARIPKEEAKIDWSRHFVSNMKRFAAKRMIRDLPLFKKDPGAMYDGDIGTGGGTQKRLGAYQDLTPGLDPSEFADAFYAPYDDGSEDLGCQGPSCSDFTSREFFPDDYDLWNEFERSYGISERFAADPAVLDSDIDDADGDAEYDGNEFDPDSFFDTGGGILDAFNWSHYVKSAYVQRNQTVVYFGKCSVKEVRTFGVYQERVTRICPECGSPVRTYRVSPDGLIADDIVTYVKTSPIMCRTSEFERLKLLYLRNAASLDDDGHTLLDFARFVPQLVTPEDMGIQPWADDDTAESRRIMRTETTVYVKSGLVTDIRVMTKREARAFGYVADGEVCGNEIYIDMENREKMGA